MAAADHVLQAIQGETAQLIMRQPAPTNSWNRVQFPVHIRNGSTPLWKKHPDVDVAALFISLPLNTVDRPLTPEFLADDETLTKYEFHPGIEVLCLGYPFGAEANDYGFPILRSGRIASYPLTPTKINRIFLFDFTVFPGNSGSPVYAVRENAFYGGVFHGGVMQCVLGIAVQERNIRHSTQDLYEKRETTTPLRLGEVVHASFIKELLQSMGSPKSLN